jgi:hypothetical protein
MQIIVDRASHINERMLEIEDKIEDILHSDSNHNNNNKNKLT